MFRLDLTRFVFTTCSKFNKSYKIGYFVLDFNWQAFKSHYFTFNLSKCFIIFVNGIKTLLDVNQYVKGLEFQSKLLNSAGSVYKLLLGEKCSYLAQKNYSVIANEVPL